MTIMISFFKFIAKAIRELREDETFIFAYEESYGYLAGEFVSLRNVYLVHHLRWIES
jgi:phosphomannomutase